MTTPNAQQLGPEDFDDCFTGEPELPDPGQDLARGRQRRRRRLRAATSGAVATVTAVAVLGVTVAAGPEQTAVPAGPSTSAAPSPSPSDPAAPDTGEPRRSDTAPRLDYSRSKGYLDRADRSLGHTGPGASPFAATTQHTYDLVRSHLDPEHEHLGRYDAYAFTGGGARRGGVQIGQKLSWTAAGQAGEGLLLISVTRAAPGDQPVTSGQDRDGLCAGAFVEVECRPTTVDGRPVFLDRGAGTGFVVDLLQADGELASAWVDPLFGNNTDVTLEDMGVELPAVLDLLADPELDVVG